MKQQIKVNVTLSLEGDVTHSRSEIVEFIKATIPSRSGCNGLSLVRMEIHRILEEIEIYAHPPTCGSEVWSFIETYYPDYYQSRHIERHNRLSKTVMGQSVKLVLSLNGKNRQRAVAGFEASCMEVYGRAILGFFEAEREAFSIKWSMDDIARRALETGHIFMEREELLRVLDMLRENYDSNVGISWATIDACLDYINLNPD